jgi:hypothetical protein
MVGRAIEKQDRMEDKIANIEEQMRKKAALGYDRKREKLDAIKRMAIEQNRKV